MGLKNKNYYVEENFYPEVYAVFNGDIRKLGNDYIVGFNVNTSRELALRKALEVKEVRVTDWDRKTDIVAYAYQKGKEQIKEERPNYQTGKKEIILRNNVFTGWENDII